MIDTKFSVAGISYPAWYPKEYTWKTPQLYFCLFDRDFIKPENLDLRAGIHEPNTPRVEEVSREILTLRILRRTRRFLLNRRLINFGKPIEIFLRLKIDLLQRRFEINARDTGWSLGEKIANDQLSFVVYPNILSREIRIPGFRSPEYVAVNHDLQHLNGNIGWYFLTQGLTEGRPIGDQGVFPRMLQKFAKSDVTDRSKWPPSSLLGSSCLTNQKEFDLVQKCIPAADCYAVGSEFSLFHIGSKGKGQISDEIKVLDDLIGEFVSRAL
jgi:hypothetical protein